MPLLSLPGRMSLSVIAIAVMVCVAGGVASHPCKAAEGPVTLRLLHTNDVHAHYDEVTPHGGPCSDEARAAGSCVGGAARLTTLVRAQRATALRSLLLDAGDQFQGTLFYTYDKADATARIMPLVGYDAMAVGNHEFDDGPDGLAHLLAQVDFPVLSANIDVSDTPTLRGSLPHHHLFHLNGVPVGVFGLTTPDTATQSSPGPTVRFRDPVATARSEVAALTEQGVQIIVALTHLGYRADLDLAARVDGLDVILGGHSHTRLGPDEGAAGPYPTVVSSPSGAPVLVAQAGALGLLLGSLDVTFDGAGTATAWSGAALPLDATVPRDAEIAQAVADMAAPLAALLTEPVGEIATQDLDGDQRVCRFHECALGTLISNAMLTATGDATATIALMNGGGIRAGLPAGPVTRGHVLEVLPFGNTLATFHIRGEYLRAALEHAVSVAHDPDASGTGRFLQVAGLRLTWDPAVPPGQRLRATETRDSSGAWISLDDTAMYGVVTTDFIRRGGDGYAMFRDHAQDPYDYGPALDELVADYIAARSPLAPKKTADVIVRVDGL